jgi:hypothetical protein
MNGENPDDTNRPTRVVADDPEDQKGRLKTLGGSKSDRWNSLLANQAVQALWIKHSDAETRESQYSTAIAALSALARRTSWKG